MKRKLLYEKSIVNISCRKGKIRKIAWKQIRIVFNIKHKYSKLLYGCSCFNSSYIVYGWKSSNTDLEFRFDDVEPSRKLIKQCKELASRLGRDAYFIFELPDRGGLPELLIYTIKIIVKTGLEEIVRKLIANYFELNNIEIVNEYKIENNKSEVLLKIKDDKGRIHNFIFEKDNVNNNTEQ